MSVRYKLTLTFLVFLFLADYNYAQGQSAPCDLRKDKEGIKVYTCPSDSSKFRSLRAEFKLENISFETLENFLWNVNDYPGWQYNMVSASLLKTIKDTAIVYRSEVAAPWPVQNREMIVQLSVNRNLGKDKLAFSMHSVSYAYPLDENLIRVPYSKARWQVRKVNNTLFVTYTLHIDPGGYVPPMLVNLAMAEGPYESFRSLKKLLENK